jgi:hypothetical protein
MKTAAMNGKSSGNRQSVTDSVLKSETPNIARLLNVSISRNDTDNFCAIAD